MLAGGCQKILAAPLYGGVWGRKNRLMQPDQGGPEDEVACQAPPACNPSGQSVADTLDGFRRLGWQGDLQMKVTFDYPRKGKRRKF